MAEYKLSFNARGEPLINGVVVPQTDTSGGTPWHSRDGLPFVILMGRNASGQGDIKIQPKPGTREPLSFSIDPAGLRYLQTNQALLSQNGDKVSFTLDKDAAATVRSTDLSMSPSGRTIIIGGAYFSSVQLEAGDRSTTTLDARAFQGPNGTSRLQGHFKEKIENLQRQRQGATEHLQTDRPLQASITPEVQTLLGQHGIVQASAEATNAGLPDNDPDKGITRA